MNKITKLGKFIFILLMWFCPYLAIVLLILCLYSDICEKIEKVNKN
jgi:hypothetical protein